MNSKTPLRLAVTLAFFGLAVGSFANTQDEKKKRQGRGGGLVRQVMSRFKTVEFSEEQKTQIKEIAKKHGAQLTEIRKEMSGLMTADQKQARAKALAAARKEGKKFAEANEIANKSIGLSEEALGKLKAVQAKNQAVQKQINEAVTALLTDGQKAGLGKKGAKGKKGGNKKAKPGKDEQVISLKLPNMK
ncbi:MAG: hypothetical protein VX768_07815 [Planctomycetota bacterium]|nr:hypothetical protein [Planctomycetota bacterium]